MKRHNHDTKTAAAAVLKTGHHEAAQMKRAPADKIRGNRADSTQGTGSRAKRNTNVIQT